MMSECLWTQDPDIDNDGTWETSCGNAFCLEDGGPTETGMKFCPYCGKKLLEDKPEEENENA